MKTVLLLITALYATTVTAKDDFFRLSGGTVATNTIALLITAIDIIYLN